MKRKLIVSVFLLLSFVAFTISLFFVDKRPIGPNESVVAYSLINGWFHELTKVNWSLYFVTDWGGIPPILLGMFFGALGLIQWIKRRSISKVDKYLFVLGGLYIVVFVLYLFFDYVVINRRPVMIDGFLEASYPSSTTLLAITFLGSALYPINKYVKTNRVKTLLVTITWTYMLFLVIGRLLSGVHWLTDIIGSCLLGSGLVLLYEYLIELLEQRGVKAR